MTATDRRRGGGPSPPARQRAAGVVPEVGGLVVVDKDAGMTSHDVVDRCRQLLGTRRVGHAGTLDPDATGVLLVGVGRCTRILRFLSGLGKSYVGEVVLGVATSTLDASGEVTGRWDMGQVPLEEVQAAAASMVGVIDQVPPMVSAVKVGGRRLHELARQGIEVDRPARQVTVDRFDVYAVPGEPSVLRIEVDCSSGTYVRSLAADLGTALGGGAHLRALRRTRVGSFTAAAAVRLEEVGPGALLPPAAALADLERIELDDPLAARVAHGLALERSVTGASGPGPWAMVAHDGRVLAVYEGNHDDRLVPGCVLEPAGLGRSGP